MTYLSAMATKLVTKLSHVTVPAWNWVVLMIMQQHISLIHVDLITKLNIETVFISKSLDCDWADRTSIPAWNWDVLMIMQQHIKYHWPTINSFYRKLTYGQNLTIVDPPSAAWKTTHTSHFLRSRWDKNLVNNGFRV